MTAESTLRQVAFTTFHRLTKSHPTSTSSRPITFPQVSTSHRGGGVATAKQQQNSNDVSHVTTQPTLSTTTPRISPANSTRTTQTCRWTGVTLTKLTRPQGARARAFVKSGAHPTPKQGDPPSVDSPKKRSEKTFDARIVNLVPLSLSFPLLAFLLPTSLFISPLRLFPLY